MSDWTVRSVILRHCKKDNGCWRLREAKQSNGTWVRCGVSMLRHSRHCRTPFIHSSPRRPAAIKILTNRAAGRVKPSPQGESHKIFNFELRSWRTCTHCQFIQNLTGLWRETGYPVQMRSKAKSSRPRLRLPVVVFSCLCFFIAGFFASTIFSQVFSRSR